MPSLRHRVLRLIALLSLLPTALFAAEFDVRAHGAVGDGKTLDTAAINRAIEAASAAGGGTVRFPAGTYLSFSIRLKSNITLQLDSGCTLLAATPAAGFGEYDQAEPNEWGDKLQYQDYGHSHFHNSLIWGEHLENIAITGAGRIDGTHGLVRNAGFGGRRGAFAQSDPNGTAPAGTPLDSAPAARGPTLGNKAVALKLCRNVVIRDVSFLLCGHFALLATGVDNLTLDNVKVDTNRDGFDIDACRQVRVSNCSVNTPNDDAIALKSSFALGEARPCENVTITNCQVTGYDAGSFLDGTFKRTMEQAPDRDGPTGRIKAGTESNGGFKNITISNCVFDRSRGLALETVDGGALEDIAISNLTMRDVSSSPLYLRLGHRARGPAGMPVAVMRRISISNVVVSGADGRYPAIIAGLPGHPIEDLRLSNIRIAYKGGTTLQQVKDQPAALVNAFFQRDPRQARLEYQGPPPPPPPTNPREPYAIPEREAGYPEPSMFGLLPAYGLFIRHAKNLSVSDVELSFANEDERAAIVLMDVAGVAFDHVKAQHAAAAPSFVLRDVTDFSVRDCAPLPDTKLATAPNEIF